MSQNSAKAARRAFVLKGRFRRFFSNLGPGLITGAADDDPIRHFNVFRRRCRLRLLAFVDRDHLFPFDGGVQIMCARLGMVTGLGLAGVIRARYPRWILWSACALLLITNIVNIAADLGCMADVMQGRQEVEEEIAAGKSTPAQREGTSKRNFDACATMSSPACSFLTW